MRISVLKETAPGEHRVALVPESVKKLIQAGYEVSIEPGAGDAAYFGDQLYQSAGATLSAEPGDLVLSIGLPRVEALKPGSLLLGSLMPLRNPQAMQALAARNVTAFSTDAIPRTTRAQSMDTLSSMNNIAGYRGVLMAASALPKYMPMLMTAAGMVPPAKVFVIGAAVAGLQAIATARRLGANVTATDVRPEVKEQIESVGAKYIGVTFKRETSAGGGYARELSDEDKATQAAMLAEELTKVDIVITTALIGGVFAPRLVTAAMVAKMKPGTILVDLGADGGGNCEVSKLGDTTVVNGVVIMAPLNVASGMPTHASTLFSRNLTTFVTTFTKEKQFVVDLADDIQQGSLITHQGQVVHERTKAALEGRR